MKTNILNFLLVACLTLIFNNKANAQWDLFTDIFTQMDNGSNQFFFDNLDSLASSWDPNFDGGNNLGWQLDNHLLDSVPPLNLDSSYWNEIGSGLDTLLDHLPGYNLSNTDLDTLLGEIDWVNGVFDSNFDSLAGLFGQYQDSLGNFPPNYFDPTIVGYDSLYNSQYNYLLDSVNISGDLSNPSGLGNFSHIFGKLFDSNLFPDIEIAYGSQSSDLKYYSDTYSADAKVIRLGSVPRFDKVVRNCIGASSIRLPIEARWHVEASWTSKPHTPGYGNSANNEILTIDADDTDKDFNPLMMYGDFAIMTTPSIGTLGNTTFKMLVSLGTELGTYAPAHRDPLWPATLNNKGYMTGLGAQAGTGVAFTTGAVTAYTLATFAQGQALRCPKPYPYTSRRLEVGVRYGNIVNVRYSKGFTSWQSENNRQANVRNQFTVGIILPDLHH